MLRLEARTVDLGDESGSAWLSAHRRDRSWCLICVRRSADQSSPGPQQDLTTLVKTTSRGRRSFARIHVCAGPCCTQSRSVPNIQLDNVLSPHGFRFRLPAAALLRSRPNPPRGLVFQAVVAAM
jgi:hypothetical protein